MALNNFLQFVKTNRNNQNAIQRMRAGLSTANGIAANAPNFTAANFRPPGQTPQAVLDTTVADPNLIFPSDIPPYYTRISIEEYSRNSWNSVGNFTWKNTIYLPIPQQLMDEFKIKYSAEPLGVTGSVGFGLFDTIKNAFSNPAQAGASAFSAGASVVAAGAKGLAGSFGDPAAGVVSAISGYAQNEFLTVMLEGPDLVSRNFQWLLSPNSKDETNTLANIIRTIKNAQAPSLFPKGYAFFEYPRVFQIDFQFNNSTLGPVLFQMKPMVLMNSRMLYTPSGTFAPYTGTHGPDSVGMTLDFMELELWINHSGQQDAFNVKNNVFQSSLANPNPIRPGGIGHA